VAVGVPPVIGRITPLTTSAESRGTRTGWLPPNTTAGTKTPATTATTPLIDTTTVVYTDTSATLTGPWSSSTVSNVIDLVDPPFVYITGLVAT